MHGNEVDPVEHLPPLLVLHAKPRIDKGGQVMCERRWSKVEIYADIANPKSLVSGLHQQVKDRKADIMAKSGKRVGVGADRCRSSKITILLVL